MTSSGDSEQVYEQPEAGGSWEHIGRDCEKHGDNVPFARPYKTTVPYLCVQCMLSAAKGLVK